MIGAMSCYLRERSTGSRAQAARAYLDISSHRVAPKESHKQVNRRIPCAQIIRSSDPRVLHEDRGRRAIPSTYRRIDAKEAHMRSGSQSPWTGIVLIAALCVVVVAGCGNEKGSRQEGASGKPIEKATIRIVTYRSHAVLDAIVAATIEGLTEEGPIPRDNIRVFNPNGRLEEIQAYIRGLTHSNTDLIISVSTPATQAVLSSRHPSIPVLYSFVSNPEALNLDPNQPNGQNVTGISNVLDYDRGFALLRTIIPQVRSIGVLWNPSEQNSAYSFAQIRVRAEKTRPAITLVSRCFTRPEEIQTLAVTLPKVDVIYVGGDNTLVSNIGLLLAITNSRGIPVFASDEGSVKAGALAAYSIDYKDFGLATAGLALSVLREGNASPVAPVSYRQGRCVVNSGALAHLALPFLWAEHGCINVK